jgi:hypothetical protein
VGRTHRRELGRNQKARSAGSSPSDFGETPMLWTETSIGQMILEILAGDVKGYLSDQKVELELIFP